LEALRSTRGFEAELYAFQSGDEEDATLRWKHKGVVAIPYPDAGDHSALWSTLATWAAMHRDAPGWQGRMVSLALKRPDALQPFERGQVVAWVRSSQGARLFSEIRPAPSGHWLSVFDPRVRFATPNTAFAGATYSEFVDPFARYGLDSDPTPAAVIAGTIRGEARKVPPNAVDALAGPLSESEAVRSSAVSLGLIGPSDLPLSNRLDYIAQWIAKCSADPAAYWWACRYRTLHPTLRAYVRRYIESSAEVDAETRRLWFALLGSRADGEHAHEAVDLESIRALDGWSSWYVRTLSDLNVPTTTVELSGHCGPSPPFTVGSRDTSIRDVARVDVSYPHFDDISHVPDEFVGEMVGAYRRLLERALALETDIGGYGLHRIRPLVQDPDDKGGGGYDLSALVHDFADLLLRFAKLDPQASRGEVYSWRSDDDYIFARLRLWALGHKSLVPRAVFRRTMTLVSQKAFWALDHQRDLLHAIAIRWPELPTGTKRALEARLLKGPARFATESRVDHADRRRGSSYRRLAWLVQRGCELSQRATERVAQLRAALPDWRDEWTQTADEGLVVRGGWVSRETDPSELLLLPIKDILTDAKALTGRSANHLVDRQPFVGLAETKPRRAFLALARAARDEDYPTWAWESFLSANVWDAPGKPLLVAVARRLSVAPPQSLAALASYAPDWFRRVSRALWEFAPATHDALAQALINSLLVAGSDRSALVQWGNDRDRVSEALNSPAGRLAQAFMEDSRHALDAESPGYLGWRHLVDSLVSATPTAELHALTMLAYNAPWFFHHDREWCERRLISALLSTNEELAAATWSGLLARGDRISTELFSRLRNKLLTLATQDPEEVGALAAIVLAEWSDSGGPPQIGDDDFRALLLECPESMRIAVLSHAERWAREDQWRPHCVRLLVHVWPRQVHLRTESVVRAIFELMTSSPALFGSLNKSAAHLLEPVLSASLVLDDDALLEIFAQQPEELLAVLRAVLKPSAKAWPWGLNELLGRMAEIRPDLADSPVMRELRRRTEVRG